MLYGNFYKCPGVTLYTFGLCFLRFFSRFKIITMRTPIKHAEPFDQYLIDNYQHKSLSEICRHLNICSDKANRHLKKLGIERSPELIAGFKGNKKIDEERDKYISANYLLKPLKHICNDLGIAVSLGTRTLKRLGLQRPKELAIMFKAKHRAVNDSAPIRKSYYTPVPKQKKEIKPVLRGDKVKVTVNVLPMRNVDYSAKIMVKIDNRTWVYRDKTA